MPAAVSEHPLVVPAQSTRTVATIAQVALYAGGAFALALGFLVFSASGRVVAGAHALAGWIVIASLWTLAVIAARNGVSHAIVWLSAIWGLATTFIAVAQFQMPDNGWITALHIVSSVGVLAWGQLLVTRVRHEVLRRA